MAEILVSHEVWEGHRDAVDAIMDRLAESAVGLKGS